VWAKLGTFRVKSPALLSDKSVSLCCPSLTLHRLLLARVTQRPNARGAACLRADASERHRVLVVADRRLDRWRSETHACNVSYAIDEAGRRADEGALEMRVREKGSFKMRTGHDGAPEMHVVEDGAF
jgi:hypothetical protein